MRPTFVSGTAIGSPGAQRLEWSAATPSASPPTADRPRASRWPLAIVLGIITGGIAFLAYASLPARG